MMSDLNLISRPNRSDRPDQFVTTLLQKIHNKTENELTNTQYLIDPVAFLVDQNSSMILCTLLYFLVMGKVHPINNMLKW